MLLTDPGDVIAIPTPSYPLVEHLAQLELITLRSFPMEFHRRWEIDASRVAKDVKAIVVVNPNNPTGSFVTPQEFEALARLDIPIISDEVFLDYPLTPDPSPRMRGEGARRAGEGPTFRLGGLSKSCGLPHYKLGWIVTKNRDAINALEL